MPPKAKLHKSRGKAELAFSKETRTDPASATNDSHQSEPLVQQNTELQEQFEIELCWCIQQLQRVLTSGKLNPKQVQENTKTLNTLMSNSAPFVKKRQVMRLTFGDYRAKMAEEAKKSTKVGLNMKITPTSTNAKSTYVKKSTSTRCDQQFRFNFAVDNSETDLTEDFPKIDKKEKSEFHFTRSGNDFRFNFSSNES